MAMADVSIYARVRRLSGIMLALGGLAGVSVQALSPRAADDEAAVPLNSNGTTINVLQNDTPGDGPDGLKLDGITRTPKHGTATIAGTSITYVPNAGYARYDSFEYGVNDGKAQHRDTATVIVYVGGPPSIRFQTNYVLDLTAGNGAHATIAECPITSQADEPFAYTVEAWFRLTGVTAAGHIIEKPAGGENELVMGLDSSGHPFVSCRDPNGGTVTSTISTLTVTSTTGWVHLGAVIDIANGRTGTLRLEAYVASSGRSYSGQANVVLAPVFSKEAPLHVGAARAEDSMACQIDEVRIWDVARTAAQLAAERGSPLNLDAVADNGPVAYYRFDLEYQLTNGGFTIEGLSYDGGCDDVTREFEDPFPPADYYVYAAYPRNGAVFAPLQWTGSGPGSSYEYLDADDDADGLADLWELIYFGDTTNAPPEDDPDDDRMTNLYEFYSPQDGPTTADLWAGVDSDGDGLSNLSEQTVQTDPRSTDTDDDGLSDAAEVTNGSNPLDSLSPYVPRVLDLSSGSTSAAVTERAPDFGGTPGVTLWLRLTDATDTTGVLARKVWANGGEEFSLGIENGELTFTYQALSGVSTRVILSTVVLTPGTGWVHVGGSLTSSTTGAGLVYLYAYVPQQGQTFRMQSSGHTRAESEEGVLQLGGPTADTHVPCELDEMRFWNIPLTDVEMASGRNDPLTDPYPDGLVAYFRFDDSQGSFGAEDFVNRFDSVEGAVSNRPTAASLQGEAHMDRVGWGGGVASLGYPFRDVDNDGLEDGWEEAHFGSTTTAGVALPGTDGYTDSDGDGINDLYEFYLGLDPLTTNVASARADADGDGASNLEEQQDGTDPNNIDTDDDGYLDKVDQVVNGVQRYGEARNALGLWPRNPRYSVSQPYCMAPPNYIRKALNLAVPAAGMGSYGWEGIRLPQSSRFDPQGGLVTIETWFRRGADTDGVIACYRVNGLSAIELGIEDGRPYGLFHTAGGVLWKEGGAGVTGRLPEGGWHHLAVVINPANTAVANAMSLTLYVDTAVIVANTTEEIAVFGDGDFYIGGDGTLADGRRLSDGCIDEFRVWLSARSETQLHAFKNQLLPAPTLTGSPTNLMAYYRFDDGGLSIEDFTTPFRFDNLLFRNAPLLALHASSYGVPDTDGDGTADWVDPDQAACGGAVPVFAPVAIRATTSGSLFRPDSDDQDRDGLPDWFEEFYFQSVTEGLPVGWRISNAPFGRDGFDNTVLTNGLDTAFFIRDIAKDMISISNYDQTVDFWIVHDDTFDLFINGTSQAGVAATYYAPLPSAGAPPWPAPLFPAVANPAFAAGVAISLPPAGPGVTHVNYDFSQGGFPFTQAAMNRVMIRVQNTNGAGWFDVKMTVHHLTGSGVLIGSVDVITSGQEVRQPLQSNSWYVYGDGGANTMAPPLDWNARSWTAWQPTTLNPATGTNGYGYGGVDPNAVPDNQPEVNSDTDSLVNLYEYMCGTNPWAIDTNSDGVPDENHDSDGDGLSNIDEQRMSTSPTAVSGTSPWLTDTDDDGISDVVEILNGTNGESAVSPYVPRVLNLPGSAGAYLDIPLQGVLDRGTAGLTNWTVGAWVRLASDAGPCTVIRRDVGGADGSSRHTFLLGIDEDNPVGIAGSLYAYIAFDAQSGGQPFRLYATQALPANGVDWAYVAATYSKSQQQVSLYVADSGTGNVTTDQATTLVVPAVLGAGPLIHRAGEGLKGAMDDVTIASQVYTLTEVQALWSQTATFTPPPGAVVYYKFDDGSSATDEALFDNFVYPRDWHMDYVHAARTVGGTEVVSEAGDGWLFSLTAGSGTSQSLVTFGMSAEATGGYDPGIDWLAGGTEHVVFPYTTGNLSRDIQGASGAGVWMIKAEATASLSLTLSWDTTNRSAGVLTIQRVDSSGNTVYGAAQSMATTGSVTIPAGETRYYVTRLDGELFSLALKPGWNLVSLPIQPVVDTPDVVLQGTAVAVWQWTGSCYARPTRLVPGRGYWAYRVGVAVSVPVVGIEVGNPRVSLSEGWQLVGPISASPFPSYARPLDVSPLHSVALPIWYYDASTSRYVDKTRLNAGSGYWFKVLQPCQVSLDP